MMRAVEGGPRADWPNSTGARGLGPQARDAKPSTLQSRTSSEYPYFKVTINSASKVPLLFQALSLHIFSVNYSYFLSDLSYPLFHHHDYDSATILLILPLST